MSDMILSGTRDFDYDEEEKFFLTLMRIIFVIFALLFMWGAYSHCKQIHLIKTGKSAVGTVSLGGEIISYTTEDGHRYSVKTSGMFLDDFEDTVMVYYQDNPAAAVPPTSIRFFMFLYGISALGMLFSLFFIKRTRKSMEKNKPVLP